MTTLASATHDSSDFLDSQARYCVCKCSQSGYGGEFMVECDNDSCTYKWYHPRCIGSTQYQVEKLLESGKWFCPLCVTAMVKKEQEETGALRRSKRTCVRRKRRLVENSGSSPSRKKRRVSRSPTKKKTRRHPLRAHNEEMNQKAKALAKNRHQWIRAHYENFKPYLTASIERKLKLSSSSCAGVTAPTITPLDEQPRLLNNGLGAKLRDYQLTSLNFMRNLRHYGASMILADEMGLGKTIQTLAGIASLFEEEGARGPHLIICPLSVAEAWHDEARKWLPQLTTVLFHGPMQQRRNIMETKLIINEFDICICTYEIAVAHRTFLQKFYWYYLVLDEAHRIKNENTAWHNALKVIRSLHPLMLTGTPIQNTMHELWALLSFCFPDLFPDSEPFDAVYEHISMEHDKEKLGKIPKLLQPFYLRRLKSDVELSLPPKEEIIIKLEMSQEQMKWYKLFLSYHANLIDKISDDYNAKTAEEWKRMRHLFMQLRKISLHPYLLSNFHDRVVPEQSLVDASGKLQVMDALLTRLKSDGHRVLLFSCFTQVLDLLEVYLSYKRWKYLRLDGTTNRIRRKVDIARFNAPNSEYFVFLISNRAGGLGINLQSADTVIHFDTDWNPQADLQAQARAHRIGQTRMVKIYRLICQDTIEERILFRSQQKLYLDAIVNKGAKMLQDNIVEEFDMNNTDLLATIRFGAQKLFQADDRRIAGIDLDALLERSHKIREDEIDESGQNESRSELLRELDSNNVRDFNFKLGLVSGRVFQGVDYKKADSVERIMELDERVRSQKTKSIVVDGLRVDIDISSRRNELATFYRFSSDDIFDKARRTDLHHEPWCWSCDVELTEDDDDEDIIECSQCAKSFHKACWSGGQTRLGVYVCQQHHCRACDAKPSQCGMIFRCVGCVGAYCPEDAPLAHWIRGDDGLHYMDRCEVAEHYGYFIPSSTYMWICCSNECKAYYETNYLKRELMDLSLKYEDLPRNLRKRYKSRRKMIEQGFEIKRRAIGKITVDDFLPKLSSVYGRDERIRDRLYFLDQYCDLIQEVYYLLDGTPPPSNDPESNQIDDDGKEREEINTKMEIDTIAEDSEMKSPVPPKIQIPIISPAPSVQIHSGITPLVSSLSVVPASYVVDRDGDIVMAETNVATNNSVSVSASAPSLVSPSVTAAVSDVTQEKKVHIDCEPQIKPKSTPEPMDYINYICEWKGYIPKNPIGSRAFKEEIVDKYEELYKSFSTWKSKSLKTVLDIFGCVIVTQKMKNDENMLAQVALSHPKKKLAEKLACFFLLADSQFLRISSAELRR